MPGYWNAHSDRDFEQGFDEELPNETDDLIAKQYEEIQALKATIARLSADVDAAIKWVRAYEEAHGPLKSTPFLPDFMITF